MDETKLEKIARQQAETLKDTLELFSKVAYLDSNGRELARELALWLDHTSEKVGA